MVSSTVRTEHSHEITFLTSRAMHGKVDDQIAVLSRSYNQGTAKPGVEGVRNQQEVGTDSRYVTVARMGLLTIRDTTSLDDKGEE